MIVSASRPPTRSFASTISGRSEMSVRSGMRPRPEWRPPFQFGFLPRRPQEQEEPAPGLPVGADALTYPLPARHRDALLAEAAGGPVRAPALRKPVLRRRPPLRRHLPGNGRGRAAPRRGLPMRLPVAVAASAAVAPDLAPDRRPVPADLPCIGRIGQSAFPQRACLASLFMGQVVAAARHDSLHASTQGLSPPSGRFATSCVEGRRPPPPLVLHFRVARGPGNRTLSELPKWPSPLEIRHAGLASIPTRLSLCMTFDQMARRHNVCPPSHWSLSAVSNSPASARNGLHARRP